MKTRDITWVSAFVFILLVVGRCAPSFAQDSTADDEEKHKTHFLALQPSHGSASFLKASIQGSSDLAALAAIETIEAHKTKIAKCLPKTSDDSKVSSIAKMSLARVNSFQFRFLSIDAGATPSENVRCLTPVLKELALELPDWTSVRPRRLKKAEAGIVLQVVDEKPAADSANATTKASGKVDETTLATLLRTADFKQVKQVLMSPHSPLLSLKYCYERGLKEEPKLAGRVRLTAVHSANGKESAVELDESTLGDKAVETCMADALNQVKFGKLKAHIAVWTIDLQFKFE